MFPLHNAVASRNFVEVQSLVADGHDINEQHYDRVTPLHMACLTGDVQITDFLLQKGAWVREDCEFQYNLSTSIYLAAKLNNTVPGALDWGSDNSC